MTTLDRDGFQIFYESTGTTDGPALLLTHGYSATHQMWSTTAAALGDSYRCVTWDFRGHGESDAPDDTDRYSVTLALDDIEAVLDTEGIGRAVLIGHSLGGYLSLRFQQRSAERVSGLVLVDTGPGYRNEEARAGWNDMCEAYAVDFETRGLDVLSTGSPEVAGASHRSPVGLVHAARHILPQHDAVVADHLPSITVPTLVVVGRKDRPFLAGADYMARKIPHARHVVIDGAGHAPMLTHATVFEHELGAFLRQIR